MLGEDNYENWIKTWDDRKAEKIEDLFKDREEKTGQRGEY